MPEGRAERRRRAAVLRSWSFSLSGLSALIVLPPRGNVKPGETGQGAPLRTRRADALAPRGLNEDDAARTPAPLTERSSFAIVGAKEGNHHDEENARRAAPALRADGCDGREWNRTDGGPADDAISTQSRGSTAS